MSDTSLEIITIDASLVTVIDQTSDQDRILDALVEKWLETKSKSPKTVEAYSMGMRYFRMTLLEHGLDLFSSARKVAEIADIYARASHDRRGRVRNGSLSENTINQRLAIISSFYIYCKKKHDDNVVNPIPLCDREKRNVHDAASHIEASEVDQALQTIKRDTLQGKRDYALLLLALTTGRRATELVTLKSGDMRLQGKKIHITWSCKGNKTMHDLLGEKTKEALETYITAFYGQEPLASDTPIFVSLSRHNYGHAMSTQAVSDICKKVLGTSKVHATRHTFAMTNSLAGASLAEIGERLGHESLQTTSEYMKRLHSAENKHIVKLESLYGLT